VGAGAGAARDLRVKRTCSQCGVVGLGNRTR
jgi:hypothetical protein